MTRKQKKTLYRILLAFVLFVVSLLLPVEGPLRLAVFLVPYAAAGWDVLWKAVRNILNGQVLTKISSCVRPLWGPSSLASTPRRWQ